MLIRCAYQRGRWMLNTGEVVRAAREKAGLSQRQLAVLSGVPQPRIAEYERGRALPRIDSMEALLGACGLRLTTAPVEDLGAVAAMSITQEDRQLITIHLAMTPQQRLTTFTRLNRLKGAASPSRRKAC